MKLRRITCLLALAVALALVAPSLPGVVATAAAGKGGVPKDKELRKEPLPVPSGELAFTSPNFSEEFAVDLYDDHGELDDAALAILDHGFRSKASGEVRAVDPQLYVLLAIIYDHFGKLPLELVSGFRYPERNTSRHYHAAACDFRIPGVKLRELYDFAKTLDTGNLGLGLYPTSGFIHLDIRAPGTPSYRWTDYTGSNSGKKKRGKAKKKPAKKKPAKKKPAKKKPAKAKAKKK